jgi:hypothetical protein
LTGITYNTHFLYFYLFLVWIAYHGKAFVKARISGLVSPNLAQLLDFKLLHSQVSSAVLLQMHCCAYGNYTTFII